MKRSLHLRSAGFTLLEIMLVVMIIALLAGSAIHYMGKNIKVAEHVRMNTDLKAIAGQLETYRSMNGSYPTTEQGLKALTTRPATGPKTRSWMKLMDEVPVDPFQNEYQYVQPGVHHPDSFDLFSAGEDHIPGTADDVGNWKTE